MELMEKRDPGLLVKMMDNRSAQMYSAIGESLMAVTDLKLSDDEKNAISEIGDAAAALSNELWKSPEVWRLIPMGLQLDETTTCPAYRRGTHEISDGDDGASGVVLMQGVVFPGLAMVQAKEEGKGYKTISKARVKVLVKEPTSTDENTERVVADGGNTDGGAGVEGAERTESPAGAGVEESRGERTGEQVNP
ncbi:Hypothetical protein D9617_18g033610 [Elsinoe fawcettii]|nr:Hypothetical protein D9617_18g033610 [Elsinoe fawcettii]